MTNPPELIRGEMRLWSDLRPDAVRPAPRGRVVATLASRVVGKARRVLVVGPHDPQVVAALSTPDRELTVVVRAVEDAEAIGATVPTARLVCGGLDAFRGDADDAYDAVVALDGVERVLSNDSPPATWAERLDLVRGFVGEGGIFLSAVDNPRSPLALADARPRAERRDTGDWEPPADADPTRPVTLDQAREHVGGEVLCAFPLLTAPTVASFGGTAATDLRVRRALRDSAAALAGRPLLFDPIAETERWLATGDAEAAAPGWIFLTGVEFEGEAIFEDHPARVGSVVRVLDGGTATALGAPAEQPPIGSPDSTRPQEGDADEPEQVEPERVEPEQVEPEQVQPEQVQEAAAYTLSRDAAGLEQGPAVGELLLDRLRRLVMTEDLPTLRRVVGEHLAWVRSQPDPGRAALLSADNVVLLDEGRVALDDSYTAVGAVSGEMAAARVALDSAGALLEASLPRIWPPWMGREEVARTLLDMAGMEADGEVWSAAASLDDAITPTPAVGVDTDLVALRTRIEQLERELWSARGEVFAHQRLTGLRDKQLENRSNRVHELQRQVVEAREAQQATSQGDPARYPLVSLDRGSMTFKVAKGIRHPVLAARWLNARRRER